MKKVKYVGAALALAMSMTLLSGCGKSSDDSTFKTSADMIEKYSSYCTLGDYTGLEYDGYNTEITDDMVQSEVDSLISTYTTTEYVTEGTAELGDTVNIDYVGSVDGEEFDGGNTNGAGTDLELGSGSYIDGFEDQIVGHSVGETFDIEVTFPEDYGVDTLNGQDAVFSVTINSIVNETVPEYNDEFVASNTDYSTIEEYEASVREDLTESNAESDKSQNMSAIFTLVMDNATVNEYPEQEMEEDIESIVSQIEDTAENYGYDLSTFVTAVYGWSTEDDFRDYVSESVQDTLKEKIVICAIAQETGIEASNDDIEDYKQELVTNYGYSSISELMEDYPNVTNDDFMFYALEDKVLEYLLENNTAVFTEDEVATDTDAEADIDEATDTDADIEEEAEEAEEDTDEDTEDTEVEEDDE